MNNDALKISNLYDLNETIAAKVFEDCTYPWEVLAKIGDFIVELGNSLPRKYEYEKRGENIWVHRMQMYFHQLILQDRNMNIVVLDINILEEYSSRESVL